MKHPFNLKGAMGFFGVQIKKKEFLPISETEIFIKLNWPKSYHQRT